MGRRLLAVNNRRPEKDKADKVRPGNQGQEAKRLRAIQGPVACREGADRVDLGCLRVVSGVGECNLVR